MEGVSPDCKHRAREAGDAGHLNVCSPFSKSARGGVRLALQQADACDAPSAPAVFQPEADSIEPAEPRYDRETEAKAAKIIALPRVIRVRLEDRSG